MDQMALSWFYFCALVSSSPVMDWFPPQDQRRVEAWQQTTAGVQTPPGVQIPRGERPSNSASVFSIPGKDASFG